MLKAGDNIIIAGIAFQVATMAVCGLVALHFFWTVSRHGNGLEGEKDLETTTGVPRSRMQMILGAEIFAYFTVIIRCIYRYATTSPPTPLLFVHIRISVLTTMDQYPRDGWWLG
jgi:hypothetical protein